MTGSEKQDAIDLKYEMYSKAKGKCFYCNKQLTIYESQLAHKIPKHKKYLKLYGKEIIHHPLNMEISCVKHNSYALLDPATHPVEAAQLIHRIKEAR